MTLLMHTNFLTMISVSLFYCHEKLFTHMNTWMIGKNLMKHHYLKKKKKKKKDFYSHLKMEDITTVDYTRVKDTHREKAPLN